MDAAYIKSIDPEGEDIVLAFAQDITDDCLLQTKLAFDSEIRQAIAKNEFEVWYQPIVSLETRTIVGYEALVRWCKNNNRDITLGEIWKVNVSGQKQVLYPKDFIEKISPEIMPDLCNYILEQICDTLISWDNTDKKDLFISMNLAPVTMNQNFELRFNSTINKKKIDRKRLHVEITEKDVINTPIIRFLLEGLRKRGHSVAIDDFPTGQSNFATLYSIPADVLKIDMSLIIGIEQDLGKQRIVQAIIALCHSLGFTIIAEGVETEDCRQWLLDNGISMGQGYLFGKAVPLD